MLRLSKNLFCLNDQAYNCLIHFYSELIWKMEDNLRWKTSFDGRRPSMEDDLWWKTTFDGRWPLMEDNLWLKTTFDWRHPLMENDLRWKTTMRTTSKTKRTCSLLEGTQRWTYSALQYFWGSLHFLCCLHILYNLHFWVGIILRLFNLFGFLGHFHIWGQTEGFWAKKMG